MIPDDDYRRVEEIARQRVAAARDQIKNSLKCVERGNPLAAEQNRDRLVSRFIAKNGMTREEAEAMVMAVQAADVLTPQKNKRQRPGARRPAPGSAEAIVGGTIDFVGIAFLARGVRAASAVARVAYRSGQAMGSGFMVAENLFLTNNHVIKSPDIAADMCVEFDYELDIRDNPVGRTCFRFDPRIFVSDPIKGLDFTLIGIADRLGGSKELRSFGCCPLSDAGDKHAIGEVVNIVQHPQGRYKEVVLRENRLVARQGPALLYTADTEPGSSGSPVFNNQWQPIALHHWGGPYLYDRTGGVTAPREVNEGIRISEIVKKLRASLPSLTDPTPQAVEAALRLWDSTPAPDTTYPDAPAGPRESAVSGSRSNSDGSTSYYFPIEITVRAPLLNGSDSQSPSAASRAGSAAAPGTGLSPQRRTPGIGERAGRPSDDFSGRGGYEPGFIPGFVVPIPKLNDRQRDAAAQNREPQNGDDPYQLRYYHFSVVVNAERKLAFFTACNIDGSRSKYINRDTGAIEPLDPTNTDHGLMESLQAEGAEASENWYEDRRLAAGSIANQDTYGQQVVPGFPDTRSMGGRFACFNVVILFGGWTRPGVQIPKLSWPRPILSSLRIALRRLVFSIWAGARRTRRALGGGKLWRAVENIVLRNARSERLRVCSFSGPIFDRNDRRFRTILISGRFFKIAVWAENGNLRSLGMIADQRPVLRVWPEALFELSSGESLDVRALGAEAFQDDDELERVDDFLTTIARIETETGLDFGSAVREGDIRRNESTEERPRSLDDIPITPRGSARRNAPRPRGRRLARTHRLAHKPPAK